MKANTLQNRIDSNLRTKSGAIAVKYRNVEKVLLGERYHGTCYSGRGRYTSKTNGDHFGVLEGLRKLGVDFVEGNDAPRGGWSGQYVELSAKGKRQVAEWAKIRNAEIKAAADAHQKEVDEIKAKDIADIKVKFATLNGNPDIVSECFPEPPDTFTEPMGMGLIDGKEMRHKRHELAQMLHAINDANFKAALNFYYLKDKTNFVRYVNNYADSIDIKYSDIAE
jgi:hypothetical protein